jgi:hypothetical protein
MNKYVNVILFVVVILALTLVPGELSSKANLVAGGEIQASGALGENDFQPNDLGKEQRNDANYEKLPQAERDYYEKGDKDYNHDPAGANDQRAKYAEKAAKAGKDDFPRKPDKSIDHAQVAKNVKEWVDSTLEPDGYPHPMYATDKDIYDKLDAQGGKGAIPPVEEAHICIEHAKLMASLMRELGYPTREKNVALSVAEDEYVQEAAVNVWYDGAWHFFDPFLCLTKQEDYFGTEEDPNSLRFKDYRKYYAVGPITDWDVWGHTGTVDDPNWKHLEDKKRSGVDIDENYIDPPEVPRSTYLAVVDSVGHVVGTLNGLTYNEMPYAWYIPQDTVACTNHLDVNSTRLLNEIIFLGFSTTDPGIIDSGTYYFTLYVQAIADAQFNISLTPTTEYISLNLTQVTGTIHSGETKQFSFSMGVVSAPVSGVGGIVEFPQIEEPGTAIPAPDSSGNNDALWPAIVAGAVIGIIGTAWYIRRRRTKAT